MLATRRQSGTAGPVGQLLCAWLIMPAMANAAASIDICREPAADSRVSLAYVNFGQTALEDTGATTDREDFGTNLQLAPGGRWRFGLGHRSAILDAEGIELQTNGYLHNFFLPLHWQSGPGERRFRLSVAPVLSGSSNVTKDPDQYTSDAFQLLAALVWSRPLNPDLNARFGICGDHRFGEYRVYPVVGFDWQALAGLTVEVGFPTSSLRYDLNDAFSTGLRVSPNGNEWYVKDRSLQRDSTLIYDAWMLDWVFSWRVVERLELSASIGREFDTEYEMTLLNNDRVNRSGDTATRIGAALAWRF